MQVGATWACRFDGESEKDRLHSIPHDVLHALEPPPQGAVVFAPPTKPLLRNHCVPLQNLPQYLHDYQYNDACPCDLQLLQPYSDLGFQLYVGAVTPNMLTDTQILSLAHLGDGRWQLHGTQVAGAL